MTGKKHGFLTFFLIIILTAGIVGGVFCVSYYKGGVTFPWEVATYENTDTEETAENDADQVVLKVVENENTETAVEEETPAEEEITKPESNEKAEITVTPVEKKNENALEYFGALSVKDGALVDEDGNAVQLTGVSSHGINWFPEFITEDSIKTLRNDWGVNVIRLAMYTSDYNGYCVGGDDNRQVLKDKIDEAVQAATDNDMYVIIDWHILNDKNPNEYKTDAIQFFGEMVRKYEDNENVIYEICNEPNGDTTWDDIKEYADEVIPVIREVDDDAIIIVGTPKWSSDLASVVEDPLDYDNIMYAYHFYAGTHKSTQRNDLEEALEEGLPVFISEYGLVNSDGDGSVNSRESQKWYDLMDEYNLSSCIWNLSNKEEGSALISSDCDATSAWSESDLSEEGQYFYDYMKSKTSDDSDDESSDSSEEKDEEEKEDNR